LNSVLPIIRSTLRSLTALALVATGLLSCDSPSEPKSDPFTLTLGRTTAGTVTGTDTLIYHLRVKAGVSFVVYVEAQDSAIFATIIDPVGKDVGGSFDKGPQGKGDDSFWQVVSASTEGDYLVRVTAGITTRVGGAFVLRPTEVNTSPETAAPLVRLNDTISTESFEQPADVDDFELEGQAGQEVVIFLQSLSSSTSAIQADLYRIQSTSDPLSIISLASVPGAASDQDFESHASGRLTLSATGRYRLRIHSYATGAPRDGSVPYRFQVYRIDRAPETLPAALTINDTLSESIDHVGDVDEFTLTAAPGSTFNLFAETGGTAPHGAVVSVTVNGDPSPFPHTVRAAPGTPLLDNPTGTFTISSTGSAVIRVTDAGSSDGLYRGPYRLFVYPIDRNPEGQSAEIVPSDAPVSGAIEQYGDVDEYSFTLTSPTTLSLRASVPISSLRGLSMAIDGPSSTSGDAFSAQLAAGSYHLRVLSHGAGAPGTFRGPYQFVLAPGDTATEDVPATLVVGDTIRNETSKWPWDVDRFHLVASVVDTVVIERSRPSGAGSTQSLDILDGQTGATIFSMYDDTVTTSPRIDLAAGGSLTVVAALADQGWAPGTRSPYQLVVKRVSAAPERHVALIALGDSVSETLDFSGDIDDYTLRGTPGQYINLDGGWPGGQGPRGLTFLLLDPATGTRLNESGGISYLDAPAIPIPAGGEVRVRACVVANCAPQVCQTGSCQLPTHVLGTYWFIVHAVNTAPEAIPASFAIGDTVTGEKLEAKGDIDEFQFAGAAGQRISAQFQWLSGYYGGSSEATGLQLQIVDAATGDVLGTIYDESGAPQLGDVATAPIVLPRTGQYLVRVQAHWSQAWGWLNVGPYRFRVVAVP
jgi:hypothetical protein